MNLRINAAFLKLSSLRYASNVNPSEDLKRHERVIMPVSISDSIIFFFSCVYRAIHYDSTVIAACSRRRCAASANEINLKLGFFMESSSDKIDLIRASTSAIILPLEPAGTSIVIVS